MTPCRSARQASKMEPIVTEFGYRRQRPGAVSPPLLPIKRYSKFLALDADGSPTGAFFTCGDAGTMRTFADKYDWLPIDTAPWEVDVTLLVTDGRGEPYRIPYPCKLTAAGWVNSPKGLLLEVTP